MRLTKTRPLGLLVVGALSLAWTVAVRADRTLAKRVARQGIGPGDQNLFGLGPAGGQAIAGASAHRQRRVSPRVARREAIDATPSRRFPRSGIDACDWQPTRGHRTEGRAVDGAERRPDPFAGAGGVQRGRCKRTASG